MPQQAFFMSGQTPWSCIIEGALSAWTAGHDLRFVHHSRHQRRILPDQHEKRVPLLQDESALGPKLLLYGRTATGVNG